PRKGKEPRQFKSKHQHGSQEHQQDPAQQGLCAYETEQENGIQPGCQGIVHLTVAKAKNRMPGASQREESRSRWLVTEVVGFWFGMKHLSCVCKQYIHTR